MPTIGGYLPDDAAEAVEEIAWRNRMKVSDVVRYALDHYLQENPDELDVFDSEVETIDGYVERPQSNDEEGDSNGS